MKSKKMLSVFLTMLFSSTIIFTNVQASSIKTKENSNVTNEFSPRIIITPDKNKDKVIYFTSSPAKVETKTVECEVGGTVTIFDQTSGFIFKLVNTGDKKFKTIYQYGAGFFKFIFYLDPGSTVKSKNSVKVIDLLHPETTKPITCFSIDYNYKNMKNIINEVYVSEK